MLSTFQTWADVDESCTDHVPGSVGITKPPRRSPVTGTRSACASAGAVHASVAAPTRARSVRMVFRVSRGTARRLLAPLPAWGSRARLAAVQRQLIGRPLRPLISLRSVMATSPATASTAMAIASARSPAAISHAAA